MWGIKSVFIFAAMLTVVMTIAGCSPDKTAVNLSADNLPGMQTGTAPWPAEITGLNERLSAINLPALTQEGELLHIHQHLDIFIEGKPVQVPYGIGNGVQDSFLAPIHTHDKLGIIHIESPTDEVYTLGQFFDIWGVRFTSECIGGYCNQGDKTLRVYINGVLFNGDPRTIRLEQHQEIFVAYGTADKLPDPIPSSYVFPEGF